MTEDPVMAERAGLPRLVSFHVVLGDEYACGVRRRHDVTLVERVPAAEVPENRRCLRVGCRNEFAKASRTR